MITFPFRIASATLSQVGRTPGILLSKFSRSTRNDLGSHLASKFPTKVICDLNLMEQNGQISWQTDETWKYTQGTPKLPSLTLRPSLLPHHSLLVGRSHPPLQHTYARKGC